MKDLHMQYKKETGVYPKDSPQQYTEWLEEKLESATVRLYIIHRKAKSVIDILGLDEEE